MSMKNYVYRRITNKTIPNDSQYENIHCYNREKMRRETKRIQNALGVLNESCAFHLY